MIEHEAPYDRAKAFHVEISVFHFERIERPFDQLDAPAERILALLELQQAPDAGVPVFVEHAQHVAVKIALGARLDTGNR